MFDMYREQIVERYKSPQFGGALPNPTHAAEGANAVCGDELLVELTIDQDQVITGCRHQSRACAICTASADLLAEHFQGKKAEDIEKMQPEDIKNMLGIPLSPTRLKCALLPLEALKAALKTNLDSSAPRP